VGCRCGHFALLESMIGGERIGQLSGHEFSGDSATSSLVVFISSETWCSILQFKLTLQVEVIYVLER
jgi:hypothetical protein